ncbi:MAG TPA: cupin domain-containing protein [Acidimicrobiales bacterium]|nr:cupin domain-containing protein [Acidimicrobiales bacterium]
MDPDLARLAALVGDVEAFAESVWGRRPMHRSSGTTFDGLLSLRSIERLLASAARRPTFRLVQDGATLPPDRSTRRVRMAGASLDDVADLAKIAAAVDSGATLVLQGLQRTTVELAELCRSVERATSHPVQANAYLTPPGSAGLARHHDEHDVLVLQVAGSKAWDVDDLGPLELVAGDVLYLPAGTRHSAAAQDGMSLHLSLGLLRVTWGDLVGRALSGMEGLDRPLPLGYARTGALAGELRDVLDRLAKSLSDADAEALAADEVERARSRRLPLPVGQLRSVLALPGLDGDSRVSRRPDHPAVLATTPDDDDRFVLRLVDRELLLPEGARPAVAQLLAADGPIRVGDLAGLEPHGQLVLARRLVREGLLVVVDDERG